MDQRGSRYTQDLETLENQGLLLPDAIVVADNVLKPGAPLFLWRLVKSGAYVTEILQLQEFAMPSEDWMSISARRSSCTQVHLSKEPLSKTSQLFEAPVVAPEPPGELI